MLSKKFKDKKLRLKYSQVEFNRCVNKFLFIYTLNELNVKKNLREKLVPYFTKKLDNKTSKVKISRRCILVNRARVSHRLFGISRVVLRDILGAGMVPGYFKASW